jgi:NAD-dependent isocitrate dehydrogenase
MENYRVTLIKGDGIGPEIADAVVEIFKCADVPIEWEEAYAGLESSEKRGNVLPEETLESIKRNKVALKSPTTTPVGKGHKSVNVTIRKKLNLFANVRPAKSLPGVKTRFDNVDLLIVRENVEDTYAGIEYYQTPDVAECLKIITRQGSTAVARYGFELARTLGRKRVTCVHKANIHKLTDGLFLECFMEVAKDYPEIQADDIIVDNVCMQLVSKPEQFDVLVLPNLYGDIVSDLCAGIVGGLGVAPGGNISNDLAVFEAVHGSAPDIAGKGLANPTALLLSSIQMLRHLKLLSHAERIETALRLTLAAGIKTRDLGGNCSTMEFTKGIISNLPVQMESDPLKAPMIEKQEAPPMASEAAAEPTETKTGNWKCDGIDIFVKSNGLPKMTENFGGFSLKTISNRGTKVYPGPMPDILLVDWFTCRYAANGEFGDAEIARLLEHVTSLGYEWTHVEKLFSKDGSIMYTKAQGE